MICQVVICFQFWVSLILLTTHMTVFLIDIRCDLLSILSIFDTANNKKLLAPSSSVVVICFQFWVSLILLTTGSARLLRSTSCDLLSILSIFDTANNLRRRAISSAKVVICFQFWVSLILLTTARFKCSSS